MTDTAGTITDTYFYTAFGEEFAKTGTTENEFRYVGEQWDANAGLYYNRARWMSPSFGSFISVDPYEGCIECGLSLHRYMYGKSNPVLNSDPTGKYTLSSVMAAIGISEILASNVLPRMYSGTSGKDATTALHKTFAKVISAFMGLSKDKKEANCAPFKLFNVITSKQLRAIAGSAWDMSEITWDWDAAHENSPAGKGAGKGSVTVNNRSYYGWDVNYLLFGLINNLCGNSKNEMMLLIDGWSHYKPMTQGGQFENPKFKKLWASQGYSLSTDPPSYIDPKYTATKILQSERYLSDLNANWPDPYRMKQ